jgi:nitrogen fixation/metabolism regulation signal transduction histidine kinase
MNSRKQTIIDRRFQLRTTFSIIGTTCLILLIVIAVMGINAVQNNKRFKDIIKRQRDIYSIQEGVLNTLVLIEEKKSWDSLRMARDKISGNVRKNKELVNENIATIEEMAQWNNMLLNGIIIFVILLGVIFYFVLIRKTHQISAPIYLLTQYVEDIIQGKYPEVRPMRRGDEFQEFYELFEKMVETLKGRDKLK